MEDIKKDLTTNEVDETELSEEDLENVSGGILIGLLKTDNFHKLATNTPFGDGSVRNGTWSAVQKIK